MNFFRFDMNLKTQYEHCIDVNVHIVHRRPYDCFWFILGSICSYLRTFTNILSTFIKLFSNQPHLCPASILNRQLKKEIPVLSLGTFLKTSCHLVSSCSINQTEQFLWLLQHNFYMTYNQSPNLPYSEGIGSPAAAIPLLKVA